jgi:hypothetical protein
MQWLAEAVGLYGCIMHLVRMTCDAGRINTRTGRALRS